MAEVLYLDYTAIEQLQKAMQQYQGNTAEAINDVLHNWVGDRAQEEIKRLMPVSGKSWKGKRPGAKGSKSLRNVNGHLSVGIKTTKSYQYLYFPDDGSNTRRHAGNQQFFKRGGEAIQDEIVQRCINRLANDFEKGV